MCLLTILLSVRLPPHNRTYKYNDATQTRNQLFSKSFFVHRSIVVYFNIFFFSCSLRQAQDGEVNIVTPILFVNWIVFIVLCCEVKLFHFLLLFQVNRAHPKWLVRSDFYLNICAKVCSIEYYHCELRPTAYTQLVSVETDLFHQINQTLHHFNVFKFQAFLAVSSGEPAFVSVQTFN